MPVTKFVPLLLCVIAAAGATVWGMLQVSATVDIPLGLPLLIPAALIGYWALCKVAGRGGTPGPDR